ncbi:unnamed protein product [Prorocentrum cordatum]|uniref:Uncharacterized protein n=1 Tax=Prorocentrum cordatum TaxID=2364126 RepID=A0ABN9THY6_9DINO|nr:unnamed protein product [Polarella glacialis]
MSLFSSSLKLFGAQAYSCIESVEIPRKIVIKNVRLGIFLRFSLLGHWDDTLEADYDAEDSADWESSLCTKTETYDYAFSDYWRYEDYSSGNCSDVPRACAGGWTTKAGLCECRATSNHFVTGVEATKIKFIHGYAVGASNEELANYRGSSQQSDRVCDGDGSGSSRCEAWSSRGGTRELRTVFVLRTAGGEEKLLSITDAPADVSFSLREVLTAAGLSLDGGLHTRENLLHCDVDGHEEPCRGDVHKLPRIRQAGLEVDIRLYYSNRYHFPDLPCDDCLDGHVGPVCKATIRVTPAWQSHPQSDCGLGDIAGSTECLSYYSYGIHIMFNSSGEFGYIDPVYVLITCAAALVYLAVPLVIEDWFVLNMLGMQSTMYRKASRDAVSLEGQLSDLLYRMVASRDVFQAAMDATDEHMSGEALAHLIKQRALLGQSDGDDQIGEKEQRLLADLLLAAAGSGEGGDRGGCVTLREFLRAEGGEYLLSIHDALKLGSADRRKPFLEKLFTPAHWEQVARAALVRSSTYEARDTEGTSTGSGQRRAAGSDGANHGGVRNGSSPSGSCGGERPSGGAAGVRRGSCLSEGGARGYGRQQLDAQPPHGSSPSSPDMSVHDSGTSRSPMPWSWAARPSSASRQAEAGPGLAQSREYGRSDRSVLSTE